MAEKTDDELQKDMAKLSDRELARKIMDGSNRTANAAKKTLEDRKGPRRAKRDVEDLIIGSGGTPKSVFRRLTGW